jgi:outer membrane protein assembly factor BamA
MRGWQARALGPGGEAPSETFVIPSQTGDLKLEANMEYRFSLFRFKNGTMRLEGVLFSDVGNVWNLTDDDSEGAFRINDFYKTIAADWGMGLRLNLQFILIRVDFGMQVYDPSLKEGSRLINPRSWIKGNNAWHFGVGYPF